MIELGRVKRGSGVAGDVVSRLEVVARNEFPSDPAMAELHLLRTLMALSMGWVTPEAARSEEVRAS